MWISVDDPCLGARRKFGADGENNRAPSTYGEWTPRLSLQATPGFGLTVIVAGSSVNGVGLGMLENWEECEANAPERVEKSRLVFQIAHVDKSIQIAPILRRSAPRSCECEGL
jgi:hypothetical protein